MGTQYFTNNNNGKKMKKTKKKKEKKKSLLVGFDKGKPLAIRQRIEVRPACDHKVRKTGRPCTEACRQGTQHPMHRDTCARGCGWRFQPR
jgi:hypothetical protein